ncbi:hypothetical protein HPP92_023391 [Vanilla planifolia]|uniref:Uncharacterized protein n=1 Tax=Vanilla planifolia TaxID=51239 RepID=A0A835PV84_VANPL|nr:hypothetical protein HPP92_023391 [Vanilla planifolia]
MAGISRAGSRMPHQELSWILDFFSFFFFLIVLDLLETSRIMSWRYVVFRFVGGCLGGGKNCFRPLSAELLKLILLSTASRNVLVHCGCMRSQKLVELVLKI